MSTYRRPWRPGATYFCTVVTHRRVPWLCDPESRHAMRRALETVRVPYPFRIDSLVLLPDHLHAVLTLPPGDADLGTRWRLIKTIVSKDVKYFARPTTGSRARRREIGLWQRRYWEHLIRDERDFSAHMDYVHYNPVKHGLVASPREWPFSTFLRHVDAEVYPPDWGTNEPVAARHLNGGE